MDPCSNINPHKLEVSQMTILLDNPLKTYFSGEMVKGTVKFKTKCNQLVQILSVYLCGEFFYKRGKEEYVERIFTESSPVDFGGAGEGNVRTEFCLLLRPDSPTSLESPLGGVRYKVLSYLVLKEDSGFKSTESSELISVNRPKPLPEGSFGRQVNTVERVGLLCCVGAVSAQLEVSRVFLLCGWSTVISGSIFNGTHSVVERTDLLLVQTVERQRDGKRTKRPAVSVRKGAILPGMRQIWSIHSFVIPPLPPTSADTFFKTSYKIVLEIQKGSGKAIKLKVPVIIGNVPTSEEYIPNSSLGFLHNDASSQIECRCSNFPDEADEFKPLYVTYISKQL